MKEALRNIWRRKARSLLTIFGVSIGIFAFVTMGALSQNLSKAVQVGIDYYSNRILVSSETAGFGGLFAFGPQVPASLADRIAVIDGVERAYPTYTLNAEEDSELSVVSSPELIVGVPPEEAAQDKNKLPLSEGRELEAGDRGKVVVGSGIVQKQDVEVGDSVTIRGQDFEVVGILEWTNADPDQFYLMSLDDALELGRDVTQFTPTTEELVTNINVIPESGVNTTDLTNQIEDTVSGVAATPPDELKQTLEEASSVFNLIVLGSAMIAVLVGGLSVINTMVMSVAERRKEIGVKRVVGARGRHIIRETVTETALIGLFGGAIGFMAGAILTSIINSITRKNGLELFSLTPELIVTAFGFALFLGIVAGLYPAWRAMRIKPVKVLREE